ncbi:hypothetical protein [Streptomyces sp. NPDC002215]|uniref:hypothetical protein n=1 Tax=Streptomyces sp. NPDC002215 TaxID=3154412 RepID=UPI00331A9986
MIHSLIAMSERAPVRAAATAAHNNATPGYLRPPRITGISYKDQESAQVNEVIRDKGGSLGAQLLQRGGGGR